MREGWRGDGGREGEGGGMGDIQVMMREGGRDRMKRGGGGSGEEGGGDGGRGVGMGWGICRFR